MKHCRTTWLALLCLLLSILSTAGCGPSDKVGDASSSPAAPASEQTGGNPAASDKISLTAEELAQAFKDDTEAANERFMGKVVELTGTVEAVGKFSYPGGYIYLAGTKWETENKQPWSEVLPGQTVTVEGKFEVGGVMMKITEVSEDRLVLTADQLAAEFQADAAAAQEKYQGKWLELRGKVMQVDAPEAEPASVYLLQTGDLVIRCRWHYDQNKFAEQLKFGDEVRLAGYVHAPEAENEVLIWSCLGIE